MEQSHCWKSIFEYTFVDHHDKSAILDSFILLFVRNGSFPYSLKISENLTVWCFQGVEKGCIGNEWVKQFSVILSNIIFVREAYFLFTMTKYPKPYNINEKAWLLVNKQWSLLMYVFVEITSSRICARLNSVNWEFWRIYYAVRQLLFII